MALYVPGTDETDPKKIIMSQQLVAGQTSTNTASITTNTASIVTNTSDIATLNASRASSSTFGLAKVDNTTITAAAGVISVAVAAKSDQVTATSLVLEVTPGRQQFHPGHPKAWAYVTQSAGTYTLAASYGVTSISKISTGVVDITLSTAFSSTAYAAVHSSDEAGAYTSGVLGSRSVTNFRVSVRLPTTNAAADAGFSVSFFGNQ